jgi:hypothetical protein
LSQKNGGEGRGGRRGGGGRERLRNIPTPRWTSITRQNLLFGLIQTLKRVSPRSSIPLTTTDTPSKLSAFPTSPFPYRKWGI